MWKAVVGVFVALLVIAGLVALNRRNDAQYQADLAKWKGRVHVSDSTLAVATEQRDSALAANTQSIPIYLEGKTKIIHDAAGTPAAPQVKACFEAADRRISACEAARAAGAAREKALEQRLAVEQQKPVPGLPRFQFYGAAGYSVTFDSSRVRAAPAFRLGIDSKLIGPVRLATDAQLTMPGRGSSNPTVQGNAMLRVNF